MARTENVSEVVDNNDYLTSRLVIRVTLSSHATSLTYCSQLIEHLVTVAALLQKRYI